MKEIKTYILIRYTESGNDWNANVYRGSSVDIRQFYDKNQLIEFWATCQAEDDSVIYNLPSPEYTLLLDGKMAEWRDTDEWDEEERIRCGIASKVVVKAAEIVAEKKKVELEQKAAQEKKDRERELEQAEQMKAWKIQEALKFLKENGLR